MKTLYIHIHGDRKLAEATFAYGKGWPLLRDFDAQLVNEKEFADLVPDAPTYWRVDKGQFGIVINKEAEKYKNTFDELKRGLSDFMAGWNAAKST